ncbi:MAG TPA: carboxypeptidase-like regulatory domain-containing protein [Candidatus Eremiobacteraceae bacterium]|nr:carboxypeptidase-like regulatory domain-containing protein [Candidatus Eremiobacteraceae bacterium]
MSLFSLSLMLFSSALAQTTVSQGSIQGTVTDRTNAVVSDATIAITSRTTGQSVTVRTSSTGTYNSGGLPVGDYVVRAQAKGFKTSQTVITVQIAVTSSGNFKLEVGQETTTVEVQASAIGVNTEQSAVQGVLTAEQIDNYPVNGRSFLDLAQLEPGVQMQDGVNFDPTKVGYNSLSINGDFGRTPRIEIDGLDVSDETVGTTTQNIALSSIQEFNIGRSSFDISSEVTSTGAVNVATRSGTNSYHGQAFYQFRDSVAGFADLPGAVNSQFQRNQFGGRFGGALIKNKLFFFIDAERLKQDSEDSVVAGAPFQALTRGIDSPFKSSQASGRLDFQAAKNVRIFYKFAYDWNYSTSSANTGFSYYANRDYAPTHAVGIDINEGNWSHTIRMGYFKFHNQIIGATDSMPAAINPFSFAQIFFNDTNLDTGPNSLAPQQTFQSNKQLKYDGSRVLGAHIIRFGATVNGIATGGFASFNGLAPGLSVNVDFLGLTPGTVQTTPFYDCALPNFVGCDPNIADYPLNGAYIGNGQGFSTELPAFGYPAGGLFDTRFEAYVGDSWKIRPNLTLNYGLRYLRDTGRTDSDLAPIPCSAISPGLITAGFPSSLCTRNMLDMWGLGLGNRIRQPNLNFAPQVGFAWDPWSNGKTAIRGGGGLYYENNIFNNVSYDRSNKLANGLFNQTPFLNCNSQAASTVPPQQNPFYGTVSFPFPIPGTTQQRQVSSIDGYDLATQVCFQPLGPSAVNTEGAAKSIADLQNAYIAANTAVGAAAPNPNFVGTTLELGYPYAPNFRTARSWQMNIGIQRQIAKNGVLTVDYLRNVGLRFQIGVDVNHVGDARYLDMNAALNAIAATVGAASGSVTQANASTVVQDYINANPGSASIFSFAGNGLDAGGVYYGTVCGGASAAFCGLTPDTGAAFAGINPNLGSLFMNFPIGRSVYSGLQSEYRSQVNNPFAWVSHLDLQVNYTLSRFVSDGGPDQHFTPNAWDFRDPSGSEGPTLEDRTHQFKFGATFDLAHHGPRLAFIGGFASPQPSDLRVFSPGNTAEIFMSNLTGDGQTIGNFLDSAGTNPGHPGEFMRSVYPKNLAAFINHFNSTIAGTLTPAGQALVSAGLFTQAQLVTLGATIPTITPPPANNAGNGYYKDVDTVLSWPVKLREGLSISPSVSFFNVFNFVNYGALGLPLTQLNDSLSGGPGSINGTIAGSNPTSNTVRIGRGTGVFAVGAPREAEFGLRIDF